MLKNKENCALNLVDEINPHLSINCLYRYLDQVVYRQEEFKHGLYESFIRFAKF